jgi:hypothetical protein
MNRDEMSNLHRGHSIDASYQASVVAMFANRSGRNVLMSDLHRGHSIDDRKHLHVWKVLY